MKRIFEITRLSLFLLLFVDFAIPARAANTPGDLDPTFRFGSTINGGILAAAQLSDGNWLIAGEFTAVSGAVRGKIAKLHPDGSTDISFLNGLAGANSTIYSLAVQSDGKILISGLFTTVNGIARNRIARLNFDGTLDTSFGNNLPGANSDIYTMTLQNDGKILIGGAFTTVNGVQRFRIARLNHDGTLDNSFGNGLTGADSFLISSAVQNDGKILIGGNFTTVNGAARMRIARLNPDGSLDGGFGNGLPGSNGEVYSIAPLVNGQILIGGAFNSVNGLTRSKMTRLNADGTPDGTFANGLAGADRAVQSMVLQADGRIVVVGQFEAANGLFRNRLARLNQDGTLDASFNNGLGGANGQVRALAVQSDKKVLIGGDFRNVNGLERNRIARLNADGTADVTFGHQLAGASGTVYSMAVLNDGKVLIGGIFSGVNGFSRIILARLHPDGTLDSSFLNGLSGPNGGVYSMAALPDGKIVIGGNFTTVNGVSRTRIARLNPNGTLDSSFGAGSGGADNIVWALAVQDDGKVIIGGDFSSVNGVAQSAIARLRADGSLDTSFAAAPNSTVFSVGAEANGKILIGGSFTSLNGIARNRIARLNPDGTVDSSFGNGLAGANSTVYSTRIQSDGKIVIGGEFTSVNGAPQSRIALLNPNGTLDNSFAAGLAGANSIVLALSLAGDGKILMGGGFSGVNGIAIGGVARLNGTPPPNHPPDDILLGNTSVFENQSAGTAVGSLSAVDPDQGDTHAYTLVSGEGDGGNGSFIIEGALLKTAAVFHSASVSSYPIRIRATDQFQLFVEKQLTIFVLPQDSDGDGIADELDNCPLTPNTDQADADSDGLGDDCDPCPEDPLDDEDGDGFCGNTDNCPRFPNTDQADRDGNGVGDVCDNAPPVALEQTVILNEDDINFPITLSGADLDGNPLTFAVVTGPAHGTLSGAIPNLSYTPALNYFGNDSFTFKANDGPVDSATATISIIISPVNDAPSFRLPQKLIGWGKNDFGQSTIPPNLSPVISMAAGAGHTLAVRTDGTVAAWGWGGAGQLAVPFGLNGVVSVAAGWYHSLALKADGTVAGWGYNSHGQSTIPSGLNNVVALSAGVGHTMALKSDGTVVVWGYNGSGQTSVPANLSGIIAIAAGDEHSLALKSDGSIVAWGRNVEGQCAIPAGLSGVKAISAGQFHSLALKEDGTVVAWGGNDYGQRTIPPGLGNVKSIAAGYRHNLALLYNGSIVAWGSNTDSPTTIPSGLSGVTSIAAGFQQSLAAYTQASQVVAEDSGAQTVSGFATSIIVGPANELGQSGTFYLGNDNPALFQAQPAISSAGVLTYTPAPNSHGLAILTVVLRDNGGADSAIGDRNESTAQTFSITVTPVNDAPVASCRDIALDAPENGSLVDVSIDAGSIDPDGDSISIVQNPPGPFRTGRTVVTLTVTDPFGAESSCQATVTILDVTPPAYFTHPSDIVVEATSASGAIVSFDASAWDAVDGNIPATVNPPSGSTFPLGLTWIETSATDAAGNSTASFPFFSVTVVDTTPPVLSLVGNNPLSLECHSQFTDPGATALDIVSGDISSTITRAGSVNADVPGSYLVTYAVVDAHGNSASIQRTVNVIATVSRVLSMEPNSIVSNSSGSGITLKILGSCFPQGALVYWNGEPQATTVINEGELQALIPPESLVITAEIEIIEVVVVNPGGGVSKALVFTIIGQDVGVFSSGVISGGETAIVSTAPLPDSGDTTGITAAIINTGDPAPLYVSAATYDQNPTTTPVFDVGADYVDLKIVGADPTDSATVQFYYASSVVGPNENKLRLQYFNGTSWVAVKSSGNDQPIKNTDDNLDGTFSGGRFTVLLDATSTPRLTELSGTVFAMAATVPEITSIVGPIVPLITGANAIVALHYLALGDPASQQVLIEWGDGAVDATTPVTQGFLEASHHYLRTGVYSVRATIVDGNGDQASASFNFIVVYDPAGGFVTGGGWINSPPGAYAPNPAAIGKATFGFVSKYQKGANVPSGNTQFLFQAAGMEFKSSAYQWLVVSGARAQYKGDGTINGAGNYGFLLTATDGQISGGGGVDKFRIKIWEKTTGQAVYDNSVDSSEDLDNANPQAIGSGSIVIHNK